MPLVKVNHVFIVPLVIISLPSAAVLGQGILLMIVLVVVGLVGMLTRNSATASVTSVALLGLIVWGRVASDLLGLGGFDTALLLLEFFLVILLMEVSNTAILFDRTSRLLEGKDDEISVESRVRLVKWAKAQFLSLGKITAAAFALSLSLLIVGDLVSVSVNQIGFSALLVLVAVVALLVLVTYGREPEAQEKPRAQSRASHTS